MNHAAKGIFIGNLFLIVCCAFYLLWWILAFKPTDPIRGIRSGWLLFPALIVGIAGGVLVVCGISHAEMMRTLYSGRSVLLVAVIAYAILLVVTRVFFHRIVTTELFLIVVWTALAITEAGTLYGMGFYPIRMTVAYLVGTVIIAAISFAAYLAYYQLDTVTGFLDGLLPLILVAAGTAAIDVGILFRSIRI